MVNYLEYINSQAWQRTRYRYRTSKLSQNCYCCERSDVPMDLHHKTYKSLGKENLNHLTKVCRSCHNMIHEIAKEKRIHIWIATKIVRNTFRRKQIKIEKKQQKIVKKQLAIQQTIIRRKLDPKSVLEMLDDTKRFTKERLSTWGVSWPPRKGWRKRLREFLIRKLQHEGSIK